MQERVGQFATIAQLIEQNIILRGADILTARGFTQVPNHILESAVLSPGAKLAYAMLLKYAWQHDYCFPGQARLAKDMGVTDRSVRTYLQELEANDVVSIKRRGFGRPNLYTLNLARRRPSRERKNFSDQERKISGVQIGKNFLLIILIEKYPV